MAGGGAGSGGSGTDTDAPPAALREAWEALSAAAGFYQRCARAEARQSRTTTAAAVAGAAKPGGVGPDVTVCTEHTSTQEQLQPELVRRYLT